MRTVSFESWPRGIFFTSILTEAILDSIMFLSKKNFIRVYKGVDSFDSSQLLLKLISAF